MARVTKAQAAANRERILEAAARLFREGGTVAVGVDALTQAAGLTHGSLYSQFGSKERLLAEALRHALSRGLLSAPVEPEASPAAVLEAAIHSYLSPRHRDAPGQGCALAALGCEVPRHGPEVRRSFTEGVRQAVGRLAALLPGGRRPAEADAMAILATLVGALVLARAVDDAALSDGILEAAAGRLREPRAPLDAGQGTAGEAAQVTLQG
ncbi:TetR/AcrR family transcriptional regulator [Roseomonas sp. GC11]|uniref:TetR/AcrR family transcriptional regulator n=1 Tax=Roseomonas sp. GC11 TaxID=2950546 RepID=UPI00210C417C|nr:TetR family transcriptional regulator [Roseomonas sp. GC11]MCQ4160290.1 TetR/AcrR family transcriptional regulator [Roseomonas sp. GC11]